MLSPQEIQTARASLGITPIAQPSQGTDWQTKFAQATGGGSADTSTQPSTTENIKSSFGDAMDKIKSSYTQATGAQGNVAQKTGAQLEGGLGIASGIASAVSSPLTGAVKTFMDTAGNDPKVQELAQNPVVSKALDAINAPLTDLQTKHPELTKNIGDILNVFFTTLGAQELPGQLQQFGGAMSDLTKGAAEGVSDIAGQAKEGVMSAVGGAKEMIKPTLTPEEATGQIIQGKTTDTPAAFRTLSSLDTTNVGNYSDLSKEIDSQIIKPGLKEVDAELAKDPTPHPIDSFEQTVGTEKVNYVDEAIKNLKELYTKTKDFQGLSDIKALETKANTDGLTYKEVNDLSRSYNNEFGTKAFSKTTGDPLTSVNAQAYENIRSGLKDTARQGLGGEDAKALDARVSDAIETKRLVDKQVERVGKEVQKTTKVGEIPQKVKPIVKTVLHPLKAIERVTTPTTLKPSEIEGSLGQNLKIIQGK